MKSIKETKVKGKKVLVRCDLDIAIAKSQNEGGDAEYRITDTFRLDTGLSTLKYLLNAGAELILIGHVDRPGGKVIDDLSSKHLKPYFNEKLGAGGYELLENLRFDPRERKKEMSLAEELVDGADIYVNECFASSHRDHTSFTLIPKLLPSFVGLRLEEEVNILSKVLKNPERPLVILIGGSKVETKLPVVNNFLKIADHILVGGKIGFEESLSGLEKVVTPVDNVNELDIGEKTRDEFLKILAKSKTVVWSGPLGKYEEEEYASGTNVIAEELASLEGFTIVGGGDTISALDELSLRDKMDFVSTGGGAMLEFLAGKKLPGLEALGYYGD